MRISKRFVAALICFIFVLAIVPPEKVFARFTALPDFYNFNQNTGNFGSNAHSWPVQMYGDCDTITLGISQPSDPYNPFILDPNYTEYTYTRWTLEAVRDLNDNPISVNETGNGLIIGDFYLEEASGTNKSNTFNFTTPLEPGTPFYAVVRYSIVGESLDGSSGTFEVGDFDHPYWAARANNTTIGTSVEFFCDQTVKDTAPTVSIIGDYVRTEGSTAADQYLIQLQLDKPSSEDIWLELETADGGLFPDTYTTVVTTNGYGVSEDYDSNPCINFFGPDVTECEQQKAGYTRHLIPAGQTYSEAIVGTRFADSSPDIYWYTVTPRIQIIRASNAFIGTQDTKYLRSRNDDGCSGYADSTCGYTFVFPGGGDPTPDRDKVSFTVDNLKSTDVDPNTGVATFTVYLADSNGAYANPYNSVVISYATNSNNVNSKPGVDYVESSGTITFASGENTKTVDIPLIVDAPGDEDLEIFNVKFEKVSIDGFPPESIDSVTVGAVIPDTATLPVVTLADTPTIDEGDAGTKDFNFTVNLDKGAIGDQTVNYAVTGTGTNPADAADFGGAFPSGSISIMNGATSGTITIPVKGDTGYEKNETFTVTISAGSAGLALGGTVSRVGTVSNDDGPAISIADVVVTEATAGASGIIFTVTAQGPVVGAQTVNYDVTGGAVYSGSVNIADGQSSTTIMIPYDDDAIVEPDETFTVTISAGSDGIQNGSPLTAIGTVIDDDSSTEVLIDGGFEGEKVAGVPVAWAGKNTKIFRKDKQKCDKPEMNKFIAYSGACAFLFKGNPMGQRSMINQKIGDFSAFPDGARLSFSVYVDNRSSTPGHPFAKLIVKYENGDKEKVILRLPDAYDYTLVTDSSLTIDLNGNSLDIVKVSFRNRLKSGKFFIDDASLKVMVSGTLRIDREILPLPEAPASFRD